MRASGQRTMTRPYQRQPDHPPGVCMLSLVLGRDLGRRRYRRDRLDALTLARQQQAQAIITQRRRPIRVPDHFGERLDIGREPFLPVLAHAPFPPSPPLSRVAQTVTQSLRVSDAVRLTTSLKTLFRSNRPSSSAAAQATAHGPSPTRRSHTRPPPRRSLRAGRIYLGNCPRTRTR